VAAHLRHRGSRRWSACITAIACRPFALFRRADTLLLFKDHAWRSIFWVSLPPGLLFVIGSFMVSESPRWLIARQKDKAYAALLRSRSPEQASLELARDGRDRAQLHRARQAPASACANRCCSANS
jgi:hypothetical protein